MAELSIATGQDARVSSAHPARNYGGRKYPLMNSTTDYIPLSMPVTNIAGLTVVSAELSVPVRDSWASQTVSVRAWDASWKVGQITWNNKPGVTGSTASVVTGALTDGQRFTVDVTALIQAIADGQPNYGWRVSTSSGVNRQVYGFDSGEESWVLTIETSDVTTEPTHVSPTGVVSVNKWVVSLDDVDDIEAIQVQIDADMTAPYAFDSGQVSTTAPRLYLTSTAYAGLADGATTQQRAQFKPVGGEWSGWSDWFPVTRHVKPTLTVSSGTTFYTPTPTIAASLSPAGSASTVWQVLITDATDPTKVRYDSGATITGATLSHQVPLTWNWKTVFPTDGTYKRIVRVWDRADRVGSYDDPTYTENSATVTLATDAGVNAPGLTISQPDPDSPRVVYNVTRAADPNEFLLLRDGYVVEDSDVDDYRNGAGAWAIPYAGALPNTEATFQARALVGANQSASSALVTYTPSVKGVWLLSDEHGDVQLSGSDVADFQQTEKRTVFELAYRRDDVDIVTSVDGYKGTYTGELDMQSVTSVETRRQRLEAMRLDTRATVQLVWGTISIPVRLRGISVRPHEQMFPDRPSGLRYLVSFGFSQVGGFDLNGLD